MLSLLNTILSSTSRDREGAVFFLSIASCVVLILTGCSTQPSTSNVAGSAYVETVPEDQTNATFSNLPQQQASSENDIPEVTHESWTFQNDPGTLITTPHYRIYTTLRYRHLREQLAPFYEAALAHYTTALTELPQPPEPLVTYMFQTRDQWRSQTRIMLPEDYLLYEGLGRGGFTTDGTAVLYYIDRRGRSHDTLAIAAHEGWHQYSQIAFKNPLPLWMEEGIATCMESFQLTKDGTVRFSVRSNYERHRALRNAYRNEELIDLASLLSQTPQTFLDRGKEHLLVYYAQVWALTRFLHEGADQQYRASLIELLDDAAHGRLRNRLARSKALASNHERRRASQSKVGRWVVLEYFNPDWYEFESQYNDYVKQLSTGEPARSPRKSYRRY